MQHEINLMTFHGWFHSSPSGAHRQRKPRYKKKAPRFTEMVLLGGVSAPIEIELPKGVCIRLRDVGTWKELAEFIREVTGC